MMENKKNIYSLLSKPEDGEKLALVDQVRELSWSEFLITIENLAEYFILKGLQPGERVVVSLPNSIEYFLLMFAITKAEGVCVALDVQTSIETVNYILKSTSPKWVVGNGYSSFDYNLNKWSLNLKTQKDLEEPTVVTPQLNGQLMMFSSGSTGAPKGALLSVDHFESVFKSMMKAFEPSQGHKELLLSPVVHMDGFQRAVMTFKMQGTLFIYQDHLTPTDLENYIYDKKIEGVYIPPALVAPLAFSGIKFSNSLQHIEVGSASHSENVLVSLQKCLNNQKVFVHYGLTECSRATILDLASFSYKINSVGKIYNDLVIKILDDHNVEVTTGESGQIVFSGEQTITHYWENSNKEKFLSSFYCTGDYGRLDSDGYLYFLGRKDDMMTRSGYHLYPAEIEKACVRIPGVQEVVFISQKNNSQPANDLLIAFFKIDGSASYEDTVKCLKQHFKNALPAHQRPNVINEIKIIPRTSSGKIDRKELIRIYNETTK